MALKTIAKAVKAVKNPVKTSKAIDKGISKAKNVAIKVNDAVMNKATKRYDKAINTYNSAVKDEKSAKGPARKYVTGKRADAANKMVKKEGARWTATNNTYDMIDSKLRGRK